jgi:hypothetical protein
MLRVFENMEAIIMGLSKDSNHILLIGFESALYPNLNDHLTFCIKICT